MFKNNITGVPKIAETDIVVWKFVAEKDCNKEKYFITPFRYMRVEVGKEYSILFYFSFAYQFKYETADGGYYRVSSQGYHSFTKREDVEKMLKNWNGQDKFCLAKCIIPKGSRYLEGTCDVGLEDFSYKNKPSLMSDKLIYKEIMAQ